MHIRALYLLFIACLVFVPMSAQVVPNLEGEEFGYLSQGRSDFFAAAIDDSTILVVGGFVGDRGFPDGVATKTCEYINTRTGVISQAPLMNESRAIFASVVLADSSIVVFGGINDNGVITASIEIFDNTTRTWQSMPDMSSSRWQHTATMLNDSLVLIAGGRYDYTFSTHSVDLFNIETQEVIAAADYPFALHNQVSLKVADNNVLLFGGRDGGTNSFRPDSLYQYLYQENTWNAIAELPQGGFTLSENAELEDGRYLVAGGALSESPLTNSELAFLWQNDAFADIPGVALPGRVYHELAVWENRYVFVIGGLENGGSTSKDMIATDIFTGARVLTIELFEERSRHEVVQMTDARGAAEYFIISGLNNDNRITRSIERYYVESCIVGDWSFDQESIIDGAYEDRSGYGNHAIISGDPRVVSGVVNEAVMFDGVDDFLFAPDNPSLQLPSFTVSLFMVYPERPSQLPAGGFEEPETYAVFNKGGWGTEVPDSNNNYSVSIDKDRIYLGYESRRNDDNNEGVLLPLPPETEFWQHYAMTFDSRYLRVYRNGQLVEELFSPYLPDICKMDLYFGRNGLTNYLQSRFFYGAIDEVKLYSCALSESEIEVLYQEGERIVSVDETVFGEPDETRTGLIVTTELPIPKGNAEFAVIDMRGAEVLHQQVESESVDISMLANGSYVAVFRSTNGKTTIQPIVIMR